MLSTLPSVSIVFGQSCRRPRTCLALLRHRHEPPTPSSLFRFRQKSARDMARYLCSLGIWPEPHPRFPIHSLAAVGHDVPLSLTLELSVACQNRQQFTCCPWAVVGAGMADGCLLLGGLLLGGMASERAVPLGASATHIIIQSGPEVRK